MPMTRMQRRYHRHPKLWFLLRRLTRVNYEREMKLLDVLCDPARTSVDVGAKLGMYSYRLLRHSGDVVAFEPIPLLARMLRTVFEDRPCRVEQCALSGAAGHTTMRIPYGSNGEVKFGRSTVEAQNPLSHDDVARVEELEVELRTLDSYELQNVGFVKIDVEGHELAVLDGARETLARERPNLLVESNDHHHPGAVAALRRRLAEQGYRGHFVHGARLVELDSVDLVGDADYLQRESIENFLFVHDTRAETRDRLTRRFRS